MMKSEVKSESIFGPLFFFNFSYIKVGVWGKVHNHIRMGVKFGQVGEILENFQNHPLGESF